MMNFPHMIPYNAPYYFVLLIAALLPMILTLAIKGTRWPWYQTLVTLVFLYISFGGEFLATRSRSDCICYLSDVTNVGLCGLSKKIKKCRLGLLSGCLFSYITACLGESFSLHDRQKQPYLAFLGISYLTFKAVQVVMDLRDGVMKEYHPFRYIQFLLFFPTISSGPIDRYRRFEKDLKKTRRVRRNI